MCRHLAYLGPPTTLATLVLEPDHSLFEQSWAPHDMRGGGTVNADGFGLGWYADGQPARYRRNVPIWTDDNLRDLSHVITSDAIIAAVRNGTERMPHVESAVAPFRSGRWLFSHNGRIPGWPESTVKLAGALPVADLVTIDAPVDSALLFALISHRLTNGYDAAEAVASVVHEVEEAAPGSRLNVLLTDGELLVATSWTHSLHVRRTAESTTVSSEPFGAGHWDEVPDRSLLVATATTVSITPMEGPQ
ncbi:ergothioneine biosynthesis protein EgtC [Kribbella sp. NPDC058245]|uniref:ergothioneine biosynthesis protein EgtC n=1 Tax=Kribbella sp. NPDC058245 TaxID=3346399 RepID=UPI0036E01086